MHLIAVSLKAKLETSVLEHTECPVDPFPRCEADRITAHEVVLNHNEAASEHSPLRWLETVSNNRLHA